MPGRSPLFAELEASTRGAFRKLEAATLLPWRAMLSGGSLDCEDHSGRRIRYSGIAFSGSPRQVFWSFFEPFLRDAVIDAVRQAIALADERCLDRAKPLEDVAAVLKGCVGVFHVRMSQMDACLQRASGSREPRPETVEMSRRARGFIDEVVDGWMAAPTDSEAPREPVPPIPMAFRSDEEKALYRLLRERGTRMKLREIAEALDKSTDNGALRRRLSALRYAGALTGGTDRRGQGYGLAEWAEPAP